MELSIAESPTLLGLPTETLLAILCHLSAENLHLLTATCTTLRQLVRSADHLWLDHLAEVLASSPPAKSHNLRPLSSRQQLPPWDPHFGSIGYLSPASADPWPVSRADAEAVLGHQPQSRLSKESFEGAQSLHDVWCVFLAPWRATLGWWAGDQPSYGYIIRVVLDPDFDPEEQERPVPGTLTRSELDSELAQSSRSSGSSSTARVADSSDAAPSSSNTNSTLPRRRHPAFVCQKIHLVNRLHGMAPHAQSAYAPSGRSTSPADAAVDHRQREISWSTATSFAIPPIADPSSDGTALRSNVSVDLSVPGVRTEMLWSLSWPALRDQWEAHLQSEWGPDTRADRTSVITGEELPLVLPERALPASAERHWVVTSEAEDEEAYESAGMSVRHPAAEHDPLDVAAELSVANGEGRRSVSEAELSASRIANVDQTVWSGTTSEAEITRSSLNALSSAASGRVRVVRLSAGEFKHVTYIESGAVATRRSVSHDQRSRAHTAGRACDKVTVAVGDVPLAALASRPLPPEVEDDHPPPGVLDGTRRGSVISEQLAYMLDERRLAPREALPFPSKGLQSALRSPQKVDPSATTLRSRARGHSRALRMHMNPAPPYRVWPSLSQPMPQGPTFYALNSPPREPVVHPGVLDTLALDEERYRHREPGRDQDPALTGFDWSLVEGLYASSYGPWGLELLYVKSRLLTEEDFDVLTDTKGMGLGPSQWVSPLERARTTLPTPRAETSLSDPSMYAGTQIGVSHVQPGVRVLEGLKVTGDPHVPRGQVTFRAFVDDPVRRGTPWRPPPQGFRNHTPWPFRAPDHVLGGGESSTAVDSRTPGLVIPGHGRLAGEGFVRPGWVSAVIHVSSPDLLRIWWHPMMSVATCVKLTAC